MMIRSLALVWLLSPLLVVVAFPEDSCMATELAWPIRDEPSLVIRGTYGDCRTHEGCSLTFHRGVDLHADCYTDVFPVKDGLTILSMSNFEPEKGWVYELGDNGRYLYGHLTRDVNPETHKEWQVDDAVYIDKPFCRVFDWDSTNSGSPGPSWDDHMEFRIHDLSGPLNNPLWQDPSVEHLPCAFAPCCSIKAVAYCDYKGCNENGISTCNTYYRQDNCPAGHHIDLAVWATSNCSTGGGPAGICFLRMASAVETVYGVPPSRPQWQHVLDLTGRLPDDADAKYVHCLEALHASFGGYDEGIVVPRNYTGDTLEDGTKMWYLITNLDSGGDVECSGGFYQSTQFDSTVFWIWLEAENHVGQTASSGPFRMVIRTGPTDFILFFDATPVPNGIELTWEAEMSEQIVGFRICRSTLGEHSFQPLETSWTACSNTLAGVSGFSYLDTDVMPELTYWYRLDWFDDAGQWRETDAIVSATWQLPDPGNVRLRAVPNPFGDFVDIYLEGTLQGSGCEDVLILDSLGRLVSSGRPDRGVFRWNVSGNPGIGPGIYFCRARCGSTTRVTKIVHLR